MEFKETLEKYRKIIDRELSNFFDEKIKDIDNEFLRSSYSFLKEYALRDGKRIRPIATIMAYKSLKNEEEKIRLPALSLELLHCSSLVHDDIMDEDSLRRNKPSMHKLFEKFFLENYKESKYNGPIFNKESGNFSVSMAILQGNILYSLAESCLIESVFEKALITKAMGILNDAYRGMNQGQMLDISISKKENLKENDYIDMISDKTAKLVAAAIEIGAVLGKASQRQRSALKKYGINAALAFQIHDDIMDISSNAQKGHDLGSDIKKGKMTLLMINAISNADKEQKEFLLQILKNKNPMEEQIKKTIEIINETGSTEYAKKTASRKIKEAKLSLLQASLTKERMDFFNNFADHMVNRKN